MSRTLMQNGSVQTGSFKESLTSVKLGVNIDHIAQVRQARKGMVPDPILAAQIAEKGGADAITVHLREDRRHIQDKDVQFLRKIIKTKLNLEMACAEEMISFACKLKPEDVCLVPEKREELTTEGGLDIVSHKEKIEKAILRLKKAGISVSLFIDPEVEQIESAKEIGADCVELHTGLYANAKNNLREKIEYRKLVQAGAFARECGLILNAGHGLDYENVTQVAKIFQMHELNIGFSIVARAIFIGMEQAVKEMKALIAG